MSYYLQVDAAEPTQFASNKGYSDLGAWIESLDADTFPELRCLYEYGWCQQPAALSEELAKARQDHEPSDRSVASTVLEIIELVGQGASVVTVTGGIGEDAP